jgi:MFS family permease
MIGVLLADVTCFAIVMPLLASYASARQASPTAIGVLVASYSAMHFLLAPLWGRLSDKIGRRPVLLIGLAGTVVSSLLFAVAGNFALLLVSRIVAGGLGATLNVSQAYVADQSPPEQRTRVMGLVGAAFGFGFIFGPMIGGIASQYGDMVPGLVATGLASVNLLVAARLVREPAQHRDAFSEPSAAVGWKPFAVPLVAAVCSTLAFTVLYVVLPLFAERSLGYDRRTVSYLFALTGLMTAIIQGGVVGRLARRLGEGRVLLIGGLLMAAGLAGLAAAASQGGLLLIASLAVIGAGFGLAGPAETGYVSRVAPAAIQGSALGLLQSANALSRVVGPIAAGVAMGGGPATAFLGASVAALAAGVLGLGFRGAGRGSRGAVEE